MTGARTRTAHVPAALQAPNPEDRMSRSNDEPKNIGGRRPPIPPALERKLKGRAQAHGRVARPGGTAPAAGGRAVRAVRHQGR
jgi:hypothetical protein